MEKRWGSPSAVGSKGMR
uniref:Uncharacterized protein n=1 Tax=Arundo donax TaxID=35708 RepID=A0A0A8XPU4_ARUDO